MLGHPVVLLLPPINAGDVTTAPMALAKGPIRIRRLTANRARNIDWLRAELHEKGITLVMPSKRDRHPKIRRDRPRYRECLRIGATLKCLKAFHKLARNDASAYTLAAVVFF